ncbi:MAG: helical backbone metal receptor [Nocardioidaceae bacterium]
MGASVFVQAYDDLGRAVEVRHPAERVVSLVPSLTEAIATTDRSRLVGATDWCTHPADLDVARVRGTKNPDLAAIAALSPDLVIANQEENRELDVRRLTDAGISVWVTVTESVAGAIASMRRLFADALGWERPAWLDKAAAAWHSPLPARDEPVVVPIWRDPWMAVGSDTFTGDLLEQLGYRHVLADSPDRYPHVDLADLDRADYTVLLPDEPYEFTVDDGPEAFRHAHTRLVSGRLLTWYGPALLEARAWAEH